MRIPAFARRALPSLAGRVALGVSACGEDDVERNVNQGAEQAEDAGSELEKAGEDAAREAEKAAEDAQDELEK
jgi:hypothetical protein